MQACRSGLRCRPLNRPDLPIKAAASRQPLVSDMIKGVISNRPLTVVYVPVVHRQEAVQYVIAVAIEPARWQKVIDDQMGEGRGMQTMLLDRHSRIISSTYQNGPEPMADGIRNVSLDARASERAGRSAHVNTIYGQPAYVASRKADFSGWTVSTFVPVEAFDSPIRRSAMAFVSGFLLLLMSGLSLAAAARASHHQLDLGTGRVGAGGCRRRCAVADEEPPRRGHASRPGFDRDGGTARRTPAQ